MQPSFPKHEQGNLVCCAAQGKTNRVCSQVSLLGTGANVRFGSKAVIRECLLSANSGHFVRQECERTRPRTKTFSPIRIKAGSALG